MACRKHELRSEVPETLTVPDTHKCSRLHVRRRSTETMVSPQFGFGVLNTLLICLAASVITACVTSGESAHPSSSTAEPTISAVTTELLADDLGLAGHLSQAIELFAARLALDPAKVKVRIQSRGCEICEIQQQPKQPPDLSLDEALAQIEPYDKFWLVAGGVTCYLYFNGQTVTPLTCQMEAIR